MCHGPQSVIVNTQCVCALLLQHLRRVCSLPPELVIDLADESGWVKNLHGNQLVYADRFLVGRGHYVRCLYPPSLLLWHTYECG
jgi:hypothetical protein